nr:non-ribosomal peptide synthetase [uncultured bacterium]ASV47016.1 non-ribosomal peptide synthetase [uncultured bacterium]
MNEPIKAESLAFWRTFMEGAPRLLELPRDFPRPAVQAGHFKRTPCRVPDQVAHTLTELCQYERASMLGGLLSCFATLLGRYSGDTDVVVGVPFSIRWRKELEGLDTYCVGPLPVRLEIGGGGNFRELLRLTQDAIMSVSAHADLSLPRLVDELWLERDPSFNPLFQVVLNFTGLAEDDLELLDIDLRSADGASGSADLQFHFAAQQGRLDGWLEFDEDLFLPATAQRFAQDFVNLLTHVVKFPDRPVDSLPLQGDEQLRRQLIEWNRTERHLPFAHRLVHDVFTERAQHDPQGIVVVGAEGTLSNAELDQRSRALAGRLREYGVGPEVPVGVCTPRSMNLVATLFGILRAGGVYVPLDPGYPPERLAFMIEAAGVRTVLVQPGTSVPLLPHVQTITIGPELFTGDNSDAPVCPILPDNLAYIIYTSGSTGDPKGVMVSHAAIWNTLAWLQDTFRLGSDDVVAHKTSISFTDSIWELLWPPVVGARLVVIEEHESQFPRLLLQRLQKHKVTVTQFVPAQMRLFLDEADRVADPEPLPCLCWVFNGGEALSPALAHEWFRAFPHTRIANAYGMTESAI